ncbi:DUF6146 family protein [Yeosuana sp. MJ-SS3]|uniref:DUF6146 family protein n=1 Tax=Gilvirhabdus luticola TaxID=3079858 RepID=A0ABU3U932_9FLAO|nr:DUF6146 family protein [Yeosuana sp. MJ-SS3]MDU8886922.1 DUF6146 family protein [Yeosuana sp. MJ-SS3]
MKTFVFILFVGVFFIGCNSTKDINNRNQEIVSYTDNDTISISNEELEYEIIIIEPGFNAWLVSTAKPEGFYSQQYLENKNIFYVTEWNIRASQPLNYNPNLYEMQIDYRSGIDYGYEVNYKLYNYFVYFQIKYNQELGVGRPRI